MSEDELAQTIQAKWPTLAACAETISGHPTGTLRPALATDSAAHRALVDLASQGSPLVAFDIEATIGEGGMGIVKLARQRSLGRRVVVKTLRPDVTAPDAALSLLREAWITGALEHPNIVPVHELVIDARGLPVIVLKRIEGVTWSTLIENPDHVQKHAGAVDPLEFHLGVLSQVCNAVSLAHARGIIHRDLKPDNVMIGAFGEVYLVDWGIAVSLRDAGDGRLPLAVNAVEIAGTPAYMAPEMLGGAPPNITEQTDIYLLGSVLFEILVGKPPHERPNFHGIVTSILASSPTFPAGVPEELAKICTKAMSPAPSDRQKSADEVRLAVQAFLRHRGSELLAQSALSRLAELEELVSKGETSSPESRVRLYNLFGECRFGFKQALMSWPQNPLPEAGLRKACEAMIRMELASGSPEQAAVVLAELPHPPPELAREIDDAIEKAKQARIEAERLLREFDPRVGRRVRAVAGGAIGLFFSLAPLFSWMIEVQAGGPTFKRSLANSALSALFAAAILAIGRKQLAQTAVNRRIAVALIFTFFAQFMMEVGGEGLGISPGYMIVTHFFLWFVVAGLVAITVDRRVIPAAAMYLLSFLYLTRHPDQRWPVMALANFVLSVNLFVAWLRPASKTSQTSARR